MAFTDAEKVKIRHHLGYMNVQPAASYAIGIPFALRTDFVVERAMDNVVPAAETHIRYCLGILDKLEAQEIDDAEYLLLIKVDEIEFNPDGGVPRLQRAYQKWMGVLANALGVRPNPYDQRFAAQGVNATVSH